MESEKSDIPETEKPVIRFKINDRTLAISVLVLIVLFLIGSDPYFRKERMEKAACRKLRSIGLSQLAYHRTNNNMYYGTLEALQDTLYIADDFTLDNMIDGYELEWDIYSDMEIRRALYCGIGSSKFTIVAYPSFRYPPKLHTFGISEDQVIRVFNQDNGNPFTSRDDPNIKSWDRAPEPGPNRFYIFIEKVKDFFGI